ncbi:MAG: hypothetical protein HY855_05895, partial [Burkholderiales bacterium]|nr:hypothetical protein [Burkholderiales bacterium]
MGHIELQLHGAALLRRAGEPALPLRGRAALLVALVALEPGVSRERAARLLWPDAPRPRHNLRQQLLRFRQALGAGLIEGDEHLRLGADVRLAPAAPGAELLADEAPGDDEASGWLQHQRTALGRATQAAGQQAVADAERNGDLDAALQAALALCAAAPHDEASLATLMRVHYLRGEGAAGLGVYREFERRLQAWPGARPAAATLALAQALQRAEGAA